MPAEDQFKGLNTVDNYSGAVAVTPHDVTELTFVSRALFLSATAAQTLSVLMADGTTCAFTFGAAGTYVVPLRVRRVNSTGTTVTGIVAMR